MQYLIIRWVFFANAFYVFALLLRQILQIDTISSILILSQVALAALIVSGVNTLRFKRDELLLLLRLGVALLKSEFDVYRLGNILTDFAKPLLFIVSVAAIRSRGISLAFTDKRLEKIFLLYAVTTAISVCTGLFYYTFVEAIYPAYSSVNSLLGYFFLLYRSRYKAGVFLVLLALSGKRAVMLSGIFAQVLVRNVFLRKFFWLLLVLVGFAFAFLASGQISWDWIALNIFKINLTLVEEASDLAEMLLYISGGRMDELIDGLSYDFTIGNILFGKSLGYTYDSSAFDEVDHKNFHFTPASLFVQYGLIFTVLFIRYIFRIIFDKDVKACAEKYANVYVIRMYLIGSLFFFLAEYGVFGYVNFCIGLGLLAGGKSLGRQPVVDLPKSRLATT
jgi:hypothetical protein